MSSDYHDEIKIKYTLKLREQLKELPDFLGEYFRGVNDIISPRTKVGYASDLKIFFLFDLQVAYCPSNERVIVNFSSIGFDLLKFSPRLIIFPSTSSRIKNP